MYGTRLTGEQYVFGRELYAARVPLEAPEDRATWRFWDGAGWQPKPSRAVAVLGAEGGVSQTLSVDDLGGGLYLAVSKRDGDLGEFSLLVVSALPRSARETTPQGRPGTERPRCWIAQVRTAGDPQVPLGTGRAWWLSRRNTTDIRRLVQGPELGWSSSWWSRCRDVLGVLKRSDAYSPSDRPMISFWISVVPP